MRAVDRWGGGGGQKLDILQYVYFRGLNLTQRLRHRKKNTEEQKEREIERQIDKGKREKGGKIPPC